MREAAIIKTLWKLLDPAPWWFFAVLVLGGLSALSEGIGITLFIPILNGSSSRYGFEFLPHGIARLLPMMRSRLGTDVAVVFALIALKNLLVYSNRALLSWVESRTGHELRCRIFDELMRVGYAFGEQCDPGKVLDTLANESWRATQAFQVVSGSLIHACAVLVFTALLFLVSWKLSLVVIFSLLAITTLLRVTTRTVKSIGDEAVRVNAELGTRMWDGVAGIRTIHTLSLQSEKFWCFAQASDLVRASFVRLDLFSELVGPLSETLYAGLLLGILAWQLPITASWSTTLVFLLLLFRLQPNLSQLQGGWVNLAGMAGSIQEVSNFLSPVGKVYIVSGGTEFRALNRGIRLEGVSFSYQGASRQALDNVTAHLPAGKLTAIVGASGAGKTTLVHLLCRFYDVQHGCIWIDDQSLESLNLESWRSQIGLASQDTHLFSTTVRENIALGRLGATDKAVTEAAKLASAHEFIQQLPQGYETNVGERGVRLSGGQRQRIALARAFIRNPAILILDEATNALDDITDEAVQHALHEYQKNRTVVTIAHRWPTIAGADHVIVLQAGRIVEEGSPIDLLNLRGLFFQLHRTHEDTALPTSVSVCDMP
jgi:ATP-binding cassette, subfamily B, bacterial MsbA